MGKSPKATPSSPGLKPATASREDNLQYDLSHLVAFDVSPIAPKTDLLAYSRDSAQLLVNQIFLLPRKDTEEGPTAEIPKQQVYYRVPRTKPIPKVKTKTRWEQFMEARGMKKQKR